MKKTLYIFASLLIVLFLASCRQQESYRFLNSTSEISSISIVMVSFDENRELVQTEINKIDNIDLFLDDFRRISCYKYYGDPIGTTEEGVNDTVIKIIYKNNEYELINWKGQTEYTLERGLRYYAGYNVFDEAEFESLISKYSEHEGDAEGTRGRFSCPPQGTNHRGQV